MTKRLWVFIFIISLAISATSLFIFHAYNNKNVLASNQITGGSWSTTGAGDVGLVHDGNTGTGIDLNYGEEINWTLSGTYDVDLHRIYNGGAAIDLKRCSYPYSGIGFQCTYGGAYDDWLNLTTMGAGHLDPGWNDENLVPHSVTNIKLACYDIPSHHCIINEFEAYGAGGGGGGDGDGDGNGGTQPGGDTSPSGSGTTQTTKYTTPSGKTITLVIQGGTALGIVTPNGGERYAAAGKTEITWEFQNIDNVKVGKVDILLSTDGGQTFPITIASKIDNSGNYVWEIPEDLELDKGRIKIVVYDPDGKEINSDISEGDFAIYKSRGKAAMASAKQSILDKLRLNENQLYWLLVATGAIIFLVLLLELFPALVSWLLSAPSFSSTFSRFASIFESLGLSRKKKPWGIVYDSYSRVPIVNAQVQIFDVQRKKLRQTRFSTKEGRFGFLVPEDPYGYYLRVTKKGYTFPSKIAKQEKGQNIYATFNYSTPIKPTKENPVVNTNVPLDNQNIQIFKKATLGFFNFLLKLYLYLRMPLLIIGTIFALFAFWQEQAAPEIIFVVLYLYLWIYELYQHTVKFKPWGVSEDEQTKDPTSLTIVRLISDKGKIIQSTVSDAKGKFFVLANEGRYSIGATAQNYLPYRSGSFNLDRELTRGRLKAELRKMT